LALQGCIISEANIPLRPVHVGLIRTRLTAFQTRTTGFKSMHVSGTTRFHLDDAKRVRPRTHRIFRNTLLILAAGMFATAAALAVVQPQSDDALPAPFQAREVLPLPDDFAAHAPVDAPEPFVQITRILSGDTLAVLLQRLHVDENGLLAFLTHDASARAIYKLYPGRELSAGLDTDGRLVWLRYHHTPGTTQQGQTVAKWLEVRPDGAGGFTATEHSQLALAQTTVAEGIIRHSLFGATDAVGIPDAITLQMADILGSKIDFLRDLRQGDHFRVVYETYTHEGRPAGSGRVLALEFTNANKHHNALWFQDAQGAGAYYDFDGNSLSGMFLRAPLKFTRISSTFGRRKHPVHGYSAMHKGVDYAAPIGTPIRTTADGVISFQGWQRGYGNITIVQHASGYSTRYAHQSRFAAGLKKGARVAQGQLIGYVGSTGVSTGPHLHYEVRKNDVALNPQSLDIPVAQALEGQTKQAFVARRAQLQQQLQLLAVSNTSPAPSTVAHAGDAPHDGG